MGTEDVGDQFLGRGREQHVPVMTVLDPQHFLAIGVVAAAFAPEIGGLDRGHQHGQMARADLFFMHDPLDIAQHAIPEAAGRA